MRFVNKYNAYMKMKQYLTQKHINQYIGFDLDYIIYCIRSIEIFY